MTASTLRVLITGAAGKIGTALREGLHGRYALLRLTDIRSMDPVRVGEEVRAVDLEDLDATSAVMQGVDSVVHLGGISGEDSWRRISGANIAGTYNVFEGARRNGVRRVIFASSNHAVGFHRRSRTIGPDASPRPDTLYGVSKVVGETLGRYYADKFGLEVACLRIGSFRSAPASVRELSTWISHRDMVQLVQRCIEAPELHFALVYGVSNNARAFWDNSHAADLGYRPVDSAEGFAARLEADNGESDLAAQFQGGPFCEIDFSGDPARID